jgi:hypothetical protein
MLVPAAALFLVAVSACVVNDPPEAFLGPEPPSIQVDPPFADPGLNISAYAYCWGAACVDGEPPYERYRLQLPGPGAVELQPIGLADWSYQASAVAASDPTGEAIPLELTPAHVELFSTRIRHLLVSFPEAGEWDVNLSGRGPQGDAAYAFQVTVGEAP